MPQHPMDTHLGDVYKVDRAWLCLQQDCHEPAQSLRGHVQGLKAQERDGDAGSRLLPAHSLCWEGTASYLELQHCLLCVPDLPKLLSR